MSYIGKLLSADEEILIRQRQHWVGIGFWLINLFIQLVVLVLLLQIFNVSRPPSGVGAYLERFFPLRHGIEVVHQHAPSWLFPGLLLLYLANIALTLFRTLLIWFSSQEIITSRRAIHVAGILSKTVVDSSLEKINDVVLHQSLLGRLLGYGSISIMTASEVGLNQMAFVKNPIDFKRAMMEAKRHLSGEGGGSIKDSDQSSVLEKMKQLEELRKQGLIGAAEFETKRQKLLNEI